MNLETSSYNLKNNLVAFRILFDQFAIKYCLYAVNVQCSGAFSCSCCSVLFCYYKSNNCEALFNVPILYAYSRAIRPVVMNITVNYQSVNILSNCISFTVV